MPKYLTDDPLLQAKQDIIRLENGMKHTVELWEADVARLTRERDEAMAFINAKQLQKPLADWSGIPRDLYVVEASTDGVVYDVKLCSAPMAIGPEVRYMRAALAAKHGEKIVERDEAEIARLTQERDEARAALRPFASMEDDPSWGDGAKIRSDQCVNFGDLRRAKAALAKGE